MITFLEGCFPSSIGAEAGIFFSILSFQWSIFYSFFRRFCDVALFTLHLELWGSCSFLLLIHTTGVSCFHSSSLILSSFASLLNRSAVWNLSYPLCNSFNSSRGSVLLFLQVSSHLVKFLLIPSICSRSAVQIISFLILRYLVLTGVVSIYIFPSTSRFFAMFFVPLF